MISPHKYFTPVTESMKELHRALPFSLRSNRRINRALRAAYRKFDRTEPKTNQTGESGCPVMLFGRFDEVVTPTISGLSSSITTLGNIRGDQAPIGMWRCRRPNKGAAKIN